MSVANLLLGRRDFCSENEIVEQIRRSKNYRNDLEEGPGYGLLIFDTSNQNTWLVCSPKRLYVILDDIRRPEPRVQWTTKQIPPKVGMDSKSERTGIVYLNERPKGWLYSKRIFATIPIEDQIQNLVQRDKKPAVQAKKAEIS